MDCKAGAFQRTLMEWVTVMGMSTFIRAIKKVSINILPDQSGSYFFNIYSICLGLHVTEKGEAVFIWIIFPDVELLYVQD